MSTKKRFETRVPSMNLASISKRRAPGRIEFQRMGATLDLSLHGLRVESREPLQQGDALHVEFVLGGEIVSSDARVMHVERSPHYSAGLAFEHLSHEDRERISRFLAERGFEAEKP